MAIKATAAMSEEMGRTSKRMSRDERYSEEKETSIEENQKIT